MRRALALALAAVLVVLVACGDDDDDDASASTTTTTSTTSTSTTSTGATDATTSTSTPTPLTDIRLRLTEVASVDRPVALALRTGVDGFYLAEKGGGVQYVPAAGEPAQPVLDISGEVSTGGEQGLLGLAFSSDGTRLYLSYTNTDGNTRIDEVELGAGPTDVGARREVFATDQPFGNHNGGNILFGPDGMFWLGLGDGGAGGDPHDNGQNPDTVLGKLLRFDVADWRPHVYALGLRNPWRFTFDRETDDLWIGDVGQGDWEEIDFLAAGTPPGTNFGWNLLEGSHPFEADEAPGTVLPVYEYDHGQGQSVVGGYVYRGRAIPQLRGVYVFADTYVSELRVLRRGEGGVEHHALGLRATGLVSSFGEDADGELYVLSLAGGVYRIDAA